MKKIILTIAILLLFVPTIVLGYDYAESCDATGSCSCKSSGSCFDHEDCLNAGTCNFTCPEPLPNSTLIDNNCSVIRNHNCQCDYGIEGNGSIESNESEESLSSFQCLPGFACSCSTSGFCEYECDSGYNWDGSACITGGVPPDPEPVDLFIPDGIEYSAYFIVAFAFGIFTGFTIWCLYRVLGN